MQICTLSVLLDSKSDVLKTSFFFLLLENVQFIPCVFFHIPFNFAELRFINNLNAIAEAEWSVDFVPHEYVELKSQRNR